MNHQVSGNSFMGTVALGDTITRTVFHKRLFRKPLREYVVREVVEVTPDGFRTEPMKSPPVLALLEPRNRRT